MQIFPCTEAYEAPSAATLSSFDGACFTGSSMSAYSEDDDCLRQVDLMKQLFDNRVSSFGSCWGIQIAAVALGGTVELSPKGREVGIGRKVSLTAEGRSHPMFAGKKAVFEVRAIPIPCPNLRCFAWLVCLTFLLCSVS